MKGQHFTTEQIARRSSFAHLSESKVAQNSTALSLKVMWEESRQEEI